MSIPVYYRRTINPDWATSIASRNFSQLTGYECCECSEEHPFMLTSLIHPDDRLRVFTEIENALEKPGPYQVEYRIITRNGDEKWVADEGEAVFDNGVFQCFEGYIYNITRFKHRENELIMMETKYSSIVDSLPEVVFEMNNEGLITFGNQTCYEFFAVSPDDFKNGLFCLDYIIPEDRERCRNSMMNILGGGPVRPNEYTILRKDGYRFPVIIHSQPYYENGRLAGIRGFMIDISERKRAEEKLKYYSMYDSLTGLFNRAYFEQELSNIEINDRYPVSLILCDVDGLKLVNDTLGHYVGDALLAAVADVLRDCFRDADTIARVGGDEFAIVLPECPRTVVEASYWRIQRAIANYNSSASIPLSLSLGFATATDNSINLLELFREADNNMYRDKLHSSRSARAAFVGTLMKTLKARDYDTEGHAQRVPELVTALGRIVGIPEQKLGDLALLAQFHDIGKVGTPDRILFKDSSLSPEEMRIMQRHSEAGYRIALSYPDLVPIADWILKHHEWWNGKGYPMGIKGEDIPIECRILSIADAYDAMTSDRPYRKAMAHREAISELKRMSGIQFDPHLIPKFIQTIEELHSQDQSLYA
ncbi:MAG: HD domain-containing phosphohydrolase [Acidobacteriota bacterium]